MNQRRFCLQKRGQLVIASNSPAGSGTLQLNVLQKSKHFSSFEHERFMPAECLTDQDQEMPAFSGYFSGMLQK